MVPLPQTVISITVIMLLQVYAMWNRSKRILYVLLFIYVPEVIATIIFVGVFDTSPYLSSMSWINFMSHSGLTQVTPDLLPPSLSVTTVQVLDFSFCNTSHNHTSLIAAVYASMPQFVLSAILLVLAVTQTLKESINMYKATKQWQPNRYMGQLVKDGIMYFLVCVLVSPSFSFPFATVMFSPPSWRLALRYKLTNHSVIFF